MSYLVFVFAGIFFKDNLHIDWLFQRYVGGFGDGVVVEEVAAAGGAHGGAAGRVGEGCHVFHESGEVAAE